MSTALQPETQTYTERTTCRACHTKHLRPVLSLGVQYLPRFVPEVDDTLPKAPLELVQCENCELLQLRHTVNPDSVYRKFWYRSSINNSMKTALDDVVKDGQDKEGVWLDIGANDGYLLNRVPKKFRKIAVEPAMNFKDELAEIANEVVADYFSADLIDEPCDVITSVAMFYDVDEPDDMVRDIAKLLKPDGIWINQLNDAPTMLKRNAFDSICHEHLCYYDAHTIAKLYARHGLKVVSIKFNEVNGGSMRIIARKGGPDYPLRDIPEATPIRADNFARRVVRWKKVMRELLAGLPGDIWCYGASTKGSVLLQYLDMHDRFFAIADRNPEKHGLKMAGSWLPITDETVFRKAQANYAVVLPWAFKEEFLFRENQTIAKGCGLIFPLPEISIIV